MSAIDFDNEKSPFTPSGDLEDESNLNEIMMEDHDADEDAVAGEQEFASEALLEDESAEADDDEEESDED